jgi:anti-sigma B factor antagonist
VTIDLEVATSGGLAAVAVRGELDIHSAPELRAALVGVLDGGATKLVIDLGGVAFMDSSGLGVLVGAHRRLDHLGSKLQLVGVQDPVARLLSVTGLTRVFDVRDEAGVALVS